jgi:hypothetical protein
MQLLAVQDMLGNAGRASTPWMLIFHEFIQQKQRGDGMAQMVGDSLVKLRIYGKPVVFALFQSVICPSGMEEHVGCGRPNLVNDPCSEYELNNWGTIWRTTKYDHWSNKTISLWEDDGVDLAPGMGRIMDSFKFRGMSHYIRLKI